jgi:hypothetical protein
VSASSAERQPDEGAASLYRQLLQSRWSELPEAIRRFHSTFAPQQSRGRFRVVNGAGTAARLLTRLLALPSTDHLIEGTLTVRREGESEVWVRRFGTHVLESKQFAGRGTMLLERFGAIELSFELERGDGQLIYRQTGGALRLGPIRFPLPALLRPSVYAAERVAAAHPQVVEITVEVRWPCSRLLVAYYGIIQFDTASRL